MRPEEGQGVLPRWIQVLELEFGIDIIIKHGLLNAQIAERVRLNDAVGRSPRGNRSGGTVAGIRIAGRTRFKPKRRPPSSHRAVDVRQDREELAAIDAVP